MTLRGEEIPATVAESDGPVAGITGEDLLATYALQQGRSSSESLPLDVQRLQLAQEGPYEDARFGLPALCELSEAGTDTAIEDASGVYPAKYSALVRSLLPDKVDLDDWDALDGGVEVTMAKDPTRDKAVDIVLTGRTARENDLIVDDVLFKSDGILLYNGPGAGLKQVSSAPTGEELRSRLRLYSGRLIRSGYDDLFTPTRRGPSVRTDDYQRLIRAYAETLEAER